MQKHWRCIQPWCCEHLPLSLRLKVEFKGHFRVALVFYFNYDRIDIMKNKQCTKCRESKTVDMFNKDSSKKDKLCCWCKGCQKKKTTEWYQGDNKIKRKRNVNEYYHQNKETLLPKMREYATSAHRIEATKQHKREWYARNKNKAMQSANIRKKERRRTEPNFRLRESISSRIRAAIKNGSKSSQTLELLGCTIPELREHLETKFQTGMSWDNYGIKGWHVDHIRPCSSYNLSDPDQQRECFNHTNLQPLWATENLEKGDRFEK